MNNENNCTNVTDPGHLEQAGRRAALECFCAERLGVLRAPHRCGPPRSPPAAAGSPPPSSSAPPAGCPTRGPSGWRSSAGTQDRAAVSWGQRGEPRLAAHGHARATRAGATRPRARELLALGQSDHRIHRTAPSVWKAKPV